MTITAIDVCGEHRWQGESISEKGSYGANGFTGGRTYLDRSNPRAIWRARGGFVANGMCTFEDTNWNVYDYAGDMRYWRSSKLNYDRMRETGRIVTSDRAYVGSWRWRYK